MMGTRHLIVVQKDGEYKIAQYGQWDGYPEVQGVTVLRFISNLANQESLKASLIKIKAPSEDFLDSYNKNAPEWSSDPDNRTEEQKAWFDKFASRNIGAEILSNVANSKLNEIYLINKADFAGDSLFCEFAYVVDFDTETFEVFKGFNQSPLNEQDRFFSMKSDHGYYPVKLCQKFKLDSLPSESEFLDLFQENEEEDAA